MAHFFFRDFAAQLGEGLAQRRKSGERIAPHNGHGVVRRKIVAVVSEPYEVKSVDQAVSGVAGDDVDFLVDERAIDKTEINDAGRGGEMQAVSFAPTAKTVGTLEEFVTDADAPLGSYRGEVGVLLQMKLVGVVTANDHRERVLETERLSDFEVEAMGVPLLDPLKDIGGIVGDGFV